MAGAVHVHVVVMLLWCYLCMVMVDGAMATCLLGGHLSYRACPVTDLEYVSSMAGRCCRQALQPLHTAPLLTDGVQNSHVRARGGVGEV